MLHDRVRKRAGGGFTLIEIAIVLAVVGLLLGGILKGQELINNAKVRAIADRQNSLKSAWFAFVDRYGGLPGDFGRVDIYLAGATPGNGDGNVEWLESSLAFQHLSAAGFLRCPQCTSTERGASNANNAPVNTYGGIMSIWADGAFYFQLNLDQGKVRDNERLQIHTGPRIPSNIIAEVDRKIDDGIPNTGDFVANVFEPSFSTGTFDVYSEGDVDGTNIGLQCVRRGPPAFSPGLRDSGEIQFWRPEALSSSNSPPVWPNCGASVFI